MLQNIKLKGRIPIKVVEENKRHFIYTLAHMTIYVPKYAFVCVCIYTQIYKYACASSKVKIVTLTFINTGTQVYRLRRGCEFLLNNEFSYRFPDLCGSNCYMGLFLSS